MTRSAVLLFSVLQPSDCHSLQTADYRPGLKSSLAIHPVAFNSWDCVDSFGLFQAYCTTCLKWVTIDYIMGGRRYSDIPRDVYSGRALDAGYYYYYYYYVAVSGLFMQVLGAFYDVFLSLSTGSFYSPKGYVCQGVGSALVFAPTMALVSSYFTTNRAVAVYGMSSGTATGRVVFSCHRPAAPTQHRNRMDGQNHGFCLCGKCRHRACPDQIDDHGAERRPHNRDQMLVQAVQFGNVGRGDRLVFCLLLCKLSAALK